MFTYPKQRMLLNSLQGYTHLRVWHENLAKEVFHQRGYVSGVGWLALVNCFIDELRGLCLKRGLPGYQLDKENSQTPNINLVRMPSSSQDLWSDINRSSAICLSFLVLKFQLFSEAKVNQLYVTAVFHRQNDILGF